MLAEFGKLMVLVQLAAGWKPETVSTWNKDIFKLR
jgi:hypothetical protein